MDRRASDAEFTAFVEAEREWLGRLAVMLVRDRSAAEHHPAGSWGSTRVSLCQAHPDLGQSSLLVREFPAAQTMAVVACFDSTERASRARAAILRWYRTCGAETKGARNSGWTGRNLALTTRGASPLTATATEATIPPDSASNAQWERASVVQAGSRLAWVLQGARGQDNECSLLPSDVVGQRGAYASAEAVARRLLRRRVALWGVITPASGRTRLCGRTGSSRSGNPGPR